MPWEVSNLITSKAFAHMDLLINASLSILLQPAAIVTHKESGGRLDVMRELLRYCKKKDISIVESRNSSTQWTPLIVASYKGYADVAELLLEYGADLSARGKKGFTALIAASQVCLSTGIRFDTLQ